MQVQQDMDSLIANELEEGERVLWTGRPNPRSRNRSSVTFVFVILTLIFGIIGIVLLIVAFIILSTVPSTGGSDASLALFITGAVFLFLAILYSIFAVFYRQNFKGTVYAITDQRIIIAIAGNRLIVYSYGKGDIGVLNRIELPDGSGNLIFAMNRPASPYGSYGGYGYYGGYSTYGAGSRSTYGAAANAGRFIGIPNVHEVEWIVRRTFK